MFHSVPFLFPPMPFNTVASRLYWQRFGGNSPSIRYEELLHELIFRTNADFQCMITHRDVSQG